MDIFYTKETLFVDLTDMINFNTVDILEKKVFNILDIYDIDNIVINILNKNEFDQELIGNFIEKYQNKYAGNMIIN